MVIPVAIIGNGAAAAEAVRALREHGYAGEIHLFADNDHGPYNPMLGTYVVSGAIPSERAFPFGAGRTFYDSYGVTAHLGTAVTALDPDAQELQHSRRRELRVRALPSGHGSPAFSAPHHGTARGGDVAVRARVHHPDPSPTRWLSSRRSTTFAPSPIAARLCAAAVVGASFAGVKVAAALHELGMKVVLIERESSMLPLSAHPWCARLLENHLLEEGYDLRLGAALAGVDVTSGRVRLDFGALPGVADPGGAGGTACDESATQEEVDLVVVCTGSRPALSFLKPGSVDTGVGILVDEEMRSSIPTLYAAGDVAQGRNLLSGRHEIIGLWASARYQGRAAGRSMAGAGPGYRGSVPHNITHVGRMLFASIGCLREYDNVTTCSEDGTYQLRVWQDGRLAGVNLWIAVCRRAP